MDIGECVDEMLRELPDLELTRFIGIRTKKGTFCVPVDILRRLLEEEHEIWVRNFVAEGN